jgi:transcriptional regulator with XRE-family HTH domain
VAAALGLHFTGISRIENGVKPPTERNIRDWCAACGAEKQIADLIMTARAVESSYLEWTRQSRAGCADLVTCTRSPPTGGPPPSASTNR